MSFYKIISTFVKIIHEAYGQIDFPDGGTFVNASLLNRRYNMVNVPIEIEIN